jgi:hypothetical protein
MAINIIGIAEDEEDRIAWLTRLQAAEDACSVPAITKEQFLKKLDMLRDTLEARGTSWEDVRAFRVLASIRNDAEELIP